MPWSDTEINWWAGEGNIHPYEPNHLNPASIDLTLGYTWRDFDWLDDLIFTNHITLYPRSLRIELHNWICDRLPRHAMDRKITAVLAVTHEWVKMPDDVAGEIKLKTTPTRKGLGHPIADWVDPGYEGKLTLMLHAVKRIDLWEGQRICQLVFWPMEMGPLQPYYKTGHYMRQSQPTAAFDEVKHERFPSK